MRRLLPSGALWRAAATAWLFISVYASGAVVEYPLSVNAREIRGIVFAGDGTAWESSELGVRRLERDGTATQVISSFSPVTPPVIGSDGAIWVGVENDLTRIDPITNAVTQLALAASIRGLVVGPDGLLWTLIFPSTLVRVQTSGAIASTAPLTVTLSPFTDDYGVTVVSAGGFVWSRSSQNLVRISADGTTLLFPAPLPRGFFWIASGGDSLWLSTDPFTASDPRFVVRVGFDGELLNQFPVPISSGSAIYGFAGDAEGNLWISEEFSGHIVRMTRDGGVTRVFGVSTETAPCAPWGPEPIAFSNDGRAAIGKGFSPDPAASPSDPCFIDPRARAKTVIFDIPAGPGQDIPTAGFTTLLTLAVALGVLGLVRLRL